MPPALPVVRIVAPGRNVGKTLLASRLIAELAGRGYVVAAVKHSHHSVPPDRGGSDTDRLARAGAAIVSFCGGDGVFVRRDTPAATLASAIGGIVGEADIVIAEGFKDDALGSSIALTPGVHVAARLESMNGELILATTADDAARLADAIEREYQMSAAGCDELRGLIRLAAARHGHLCPGVTLGVRMALAGLEAIGTAHSASSRRLSVTVEVARCATDAIGVVTACSVGRGNLEVVERGLMAATFTDGATGRAVRVVAREDTREPSASWVPPHIVERHHRQQVAYRLMPDELLLDVAETSSPVPQSGLGLRKRGR